VSKKSFNTQLEENVIVSFREKCKENDEKITDIVEALFSLYASGDITLEKQIKYNITIK